MTRCPKCREWLDHPRHADGCLPAWDVVDESDPELVETAYGDDADEAAAHYGEHGVEWERATEIVVAVRPSAGSAPWVFRKIVRDWEPVYVASETERPGDWEGLAS